jgi:hypothetical protein
MRRKEIEIIPDGLKDRLTPETIQFTLEQLESKGMVELAEGAYIPTKTAQDILKQKKAANEEIIAYAHPGIRATHETTLEITKEKNLTDKGDCIIAVKANKACADLNDLIKNFLKLAQAIKITISANGIEDHVFAFGSPALKLTNSESIVIRKSDFIDNRTLAIMADKAACDLDRRLVMELKKPNTKVIIKIQPAGFR